MLVLYCQRRCLSVEGDEEDEGERRRFGLQPRKEWYKANSFQNHNSQIGNFTYFLNLQKQPPIFS